MCWIQYTSAKGSSSFRALCSGCNKKDQLDALKLGVHNDNIGSESDITGVTEENKQDMHIVNDVDKVKSASPTVSRKDNKQFIPKPGSHILGTGERAFC